MAYCLLYGSCRLLACLPLNVLYVLSDCLLYPLVYYLAAYRKKVVRANLAASFPDKNAQERLQLEKRSYRHFCSIVVETIYLSGISAEEAKRRTRFVNTELIKDLLNQGQTVLVYLGHYGNWEYQTFLTLHNPDIPLINVYRPLSSRPFDRLMKKIRSRFGAEMVEKQAVLRKMVLLKRQGKAAVFGMIADQSPSKTNLHYWTPFLNQTTAVLTGVERLAKSTGAAVVYADVSQPKRGYYTTEFKLITQDPKQTADNEITEQYKCLMEQSILRDPAYWLWTHRRWKHQPPDAPNSSRTQADSPGHPAAAVQADTSGHPAAAVQADSSGHLAASVQTDIVVQKAAAPKIKTAVVILNWNGRALMEQFLPVLIANTDYPDVALVVADNASTDDSVAWLRSSYPEIELICLEQNFGFAQGYNLALEKLEAEYLVLLNSDVQVSPRWLSVLTDYLDQHPELAACQPKILSLKQPDYFEHAGACGGFIDALGYPFCRGRIQDTLEQDLGQYESPADIFWASGACLCIRREDFFEAGGLDGRFFAHMEEIDLCWRLRSRGRRLVCLPESLVYHLGGGTLNKDNAHKTFLNFRNNLLMLYKNLPARRLFGVMSLRLVLDYVAALQFLLRGCPQSALAVLRGRLAFWKLRPDFKQDRRSPGVGAQTKIPEIYRGCILFDYYFRAKKHFSQLKF